MITGASIPVFLFSIVLFNLNGASMLVDNCKTSSCNSSEHFSVTFPFRIPQYQPNTRCGYNSNFSLSCSTNNQTLFRLPNTEDPFVIESIIYSIQKIFLSDPGNCLSRRFLTLDISASPFSVKNDYYKYTYYNCTNMTVDSSLYSYRVQCMSEKNYTVVFLSSTSSYLASNNNCTVIKSNISAPNNPSYIQNIMNLDWTEPNCKLCTYNEVCGFKGNTNLTDCQYDTAGSSANSNSKHSLIYYLIVPALLILMAIGAYQFRSRNTTATEEQHSYHPETALIQIQPTNITTALNKPSIDSSHPVFVLGEGDVLLEPNNNPCAICLCEYKPGDILKTIKECNHYFHSDCVDEWLRRKATCPVCRKDA